MPHDIDPIAAIVVFVQSHLQNIRHSLSEFSPNIDYHSVLTLKSIQHLHQTIEQCPTVLKYCFSGSWLVLLLGIPLVWSIWSTNNIARQPKASPLSIQALSAVFTPVCVAWPLPFASFFATSKLVKHGLIEIDTIALLDHICNGDLEFRDSGDLPYLFQGKLQVYGCKIDLYVPSQWILKSTIWILGQRLAFVSVSLCD
uniref:Uncharacterized protein n=1 Tax=Psilocybe cubensis TaxID=181762 RepID=A0A8H7Y5J1_PSICU